MIDLHCHILPALDDGAIDLDDSVAMARQAEADGIAAICSTPHIHPDHEVNTAELEHRAGVLDAELARRGVTVRITRGGELAETMVDRLGDDELRAVTLGGSGRWLLLEPKPGPLDTSTVSAVERLAERGFRAIVAHPERHPGEAFRERLEEIVAGGGLIQVTAALIAAGPAAPTLLELADEGLVHLLGSDAHSSHGGRPVRLSEGFAALAGVESVRPHLEWMKSEAPAAILRGADVEPPF